MPTFRATKGNTTRAQCEGKSILMLQLHTRRGVRPRDVYCLGEAVSSRLPKVLGGQGKKEVPEEAWASVDLDRAERQVCMYAGGNPNWREEKQ